MTNDPIDELAKLVAEGKLEITSIRVNVCGKCNEGTMRCAATPNWMNCVQCDKCGHNASR